MNDTTPTAHAIYVSIEDGCITSIKGIPAGTKVVVLDYDIEGHPIDRLSPSPRWPNVQCTIVEWDSDEASSPCVA